MILAPIEHAAKHEFEYYGSTHTTNTALKIIALFLTAAIVVLGLGLRSVAVAAAHQKPLVIRINEVGRADAVAYKDFLYVPQAPEMRYFLTRFITEFYSRNHATVREKYVDSLYFLDRDLFNRIDALDRKTNWLPKFLTSAADDQDVTVTNVVIEEMQQQPFRARVEFLKRYTSSGTETKTETWASEIIFRLNPEKVPNALVPYNPLGIAITFFRADQAFSDQKQQ